MSVQKNLVPDNFLVKNFLGPRKMFGPKKFLGQNFLGWNFFLYPMAPENLLVNILGRCKYFSVQLKVWVQKNPSLKDFKVNVG